MPEYYQMDVEEVLENLDSDTNAGLTEKEAKKRISDYGENTLPRDEGVDWFELVWGQFNDPLIFLLIFAAVVSAFLGEVTDMVVITIIIVLNAALGIYQEFQAEQALAALSAMQTPQVRVRRDGEVKQMSADKLVPGDIVLLEEGDSVPADGRLIEVSNMRVAEAALTGESTPVDKSVKTLQSDDVSVGDRSNMAFMGTAVNYGRGTMVITATGLKTELGEIADMLQQVEKGETPLQRRLAQLGQILTLGAIGVVVAVFLVGFFLRGIPADEMFLIAVSLAVAAVPEGLPALVTIGLSLGAARMVERNALIRRLPAVETLGSVNVICTDKTGTLTKNEMTATYLALPGHDDVAVTGIGYDASGEFIDIDTDEKISPEQDLAVERLLKAMSLATNANLTHEGEKTQVIGDTTEGALIVAAEKVGWSRRQLEAQMPRVAELPFSSERKAMTTIHELDEEHEHELFGDLGFVGITKGAPDQLIEWANREQLPDGAVELTDERREMWRDHVNDLASQGLRMLGIAYRPLDNKPDDLDESIERELVLLGLIGIEDPARPEAKTAVKTAREAGIRSIMITGDHKLTAEAIGRDLGILNDGEEAVVGKDIENMSDQQLGEVVKTTSAFARVSPTHKLRIVKVLQEQGNIAAMTGDGVNDAPALKQADIGVAMGITGTDVSKGAAAMVLTDDNFASIVSAVEQGRAIYDNIKKFIKYLLSSNVGEILVMFVALLVGLKVPLLAIQILWINLVTDGLPAIALGFEPAEEGVMQREPRPKKESIFAGGVGRHIILIGILIAALTLGGYIWGYSHNGLDPFSDTHGLESKSAAEIRDLVGDTTFLEGGDDIETILADWDSLNEDERVEALGVHGGEGESGFSEEAGEGLIGAVERIPRTIAFTILAVTQMFEVMAIHAGDRSTFFREGFKSNRWLLYAVLSTVALQLAVIYVPFLQGSFETAALSVTELVICFLIGSIILFAVELEKLVNRNVEDEPIEAQGQAA